MLWRQPGRLEDLIPRAVVEELLLKAERLHRDVQVVVAQQPGHRVTEPAGPPVVLHHRDQPVLPRRADDGLVDRLEPARVDDGHPDAVVAEPSRDLDAGDRHRAGPEQQHVPAGALGGHGQDVHLAELADRLGLGADGALGPADDSGAVADRHGLAQQLGDPAAVARRRQPQAGDHLEDGAVPHPVVARAVRAGHPGAVQGDGDRQLVQRHVHQQLVEGPVEERRVDGHHRVQAGHRQARGHSHRVLLGDAHVVNPVRVGGLERGEADRVQHGGGDGHHVGTAGADGDHLVAVHVAPRALGRLGRGTRGSGARGGTGRGGAGRRRGPP